MNDRVEFGGRILVIGLGSVAQCTLPLLFGHLATPPAHYTVIDCGEVPKAAVRWLEDQGASFVDREVTREGFGDLFAEYVGRGDVIIDLAWNLGTIDLLDWCRSAGVRYLNASVEVWDPYADLGTASPTERTLYARHLELRRTFDRWGSNDGPTAVLDHGANPGLVSHFTKQALLDLTDAWLAGAPGAVRPPTSGERAALEAARATSRFNDLAQVLGVRAIHISERDTQISIEPKQEGEFVNTWSVEGFYEEGIAPAEMGWGTHERRLPSGAQTHATGPQNQICLAHPGCRTWVRSWVPCGEIVGMVIRHGEAFSISEALTVADEHGRPAYRPTVHYAYCPTDAAIASMHELHMRGDRLQERQRIMNDDIVAGRDELGCLLMGHPFRSWWIGSLLDIHEARSLVPGQNATTLQVAAGVLGAVRWLLANPDEGVRLPDELPHDEVLRNAVPYLGPFVSEPVDWSPLDRWTDAYASHGRPVPDPEDEWQFTTFLVSGPH